MDRSALAKVEGGSRRVSALELARIADELGERLEWFLTDPPTSIVSYRNVQDPGASGSAMDRAIDRVARQVEFVLRHDGRLAVGGTPQLPRPRTILDLERAASHLREMLGLVGGEPFLAVVDGAVRLGLLPFSLDLGDEAADAGSLLLREGGVALINGSRKVGRRRLALVHELGHYVFADAYTVDWRIDERADTSAWEARLDRFARAVLLPADALAEHWRAASDRTGELRRTAVLTASTFRVDMATLARRLAEVKVVPRSQADQVRAVRTTKADIVELDLLVAPELAAPTLPRAYEQAVLRLYRAEVVSAARALDLLLGTWEEEDLPQLAALPEDAIWELV